MFSRTAALALAAGLCACASGPSYEAADMNVPDPAAPDMTQVAAVSSTAMGGGHAMHGPGPQRADNGGMQCGMRGADGGDSASGSGHQNRGAGHEGGAMCRHGEDGGGGMMHGQNGAGGGNGMMHGRNGEGGGNGMMHGRIGDGSGQGMMQSARQAGEGCQCAAGAEAALVEEPPLPVPADLAEGERIYREICAQCHTMEPPPNLAPPMHHVSRHLRQSLDHEDDAVAHVVSFVTSPTPEASLLPEMAVNRFGLMPPLPLPRESLEAVARYIWSLSTGEDSGN